MLYTVETDTRDDDDSNVLAKDPMLSGHEATSPPTPVANAAPAPASADETSPFGDIDLSMDCPDLADIELIKLDGSRRGRNLRNRSKRPPRATDEEEVIPEDSIAVVSPSQGPTATAVPEPIVNSDDPLAYGSAEPQLEQLWSLFGKRSTLERYDESAAVAAAAGCDCEGLGEGSPVRAAVAATRIKN